MSTEARADGTAATQSDGLDENQPSGGDPADADGWGSTPWQLVSAAHAQLREVRRSLAMASEEISLRKAAYQKLELRYEALTSAIERGKEELARLRSSEEQLRGRAIGLEQELSRAREELARSAAENTELKRRLQARGNRADTREARIREREKAFDLQERRLRTYAEALNQEKLALRQRTESFARELATAQTVHPLEDFLAMVEKEIPRTELELMKTPTSTFGRHRLEANLTELIQQRETLRALIADSRRTLREQAERVLRSSREGGLAPVPPPPPKGKTA